MADLAASNDRPTPTWRFSGEVNVPTLITIAAMAVTVAMWAGATNTTVRTIEARLTTIESHESNTPERMARIEAYAETNAAALNRIERRMEQFENAAGDRP
jgi:hypothetical protein